jgi:hypothetical protein
MMRKKIHARRISPEEYEVLEDITYPKETRLGTIHVDLKRSVLTNSEFSEQYDFVFIEREGHIDEVKLK